MANFFQPGPATGSQTSTATRSPAEQAMAKFRAEILGRLLNNMAGNAPTFKSFVQGGPATRPMPAGLGEGMPAVLQAMNQPGAFTSNQTMAGQAQGPSTSGFADATQLGLLAAMILGKDGLNLGVGDALKSGGSAVFDRLRSLFGNTGAVQGATGDIPFANAADAPLQNQDNFLGSLGGGSGIPMADAGQSTTDFLNALFNSASF